MIGADDAREIITSGVNHRPLSRGLPVRFARLHHFPAFTPTKVKVTGKVLDRLANPIPRPFRAWTDRNQRPSVSQPILTTFLTPTAGFIV